MSSVTKSPQPIVRMASATPSGGIGQRAGLARVASFQQDPGGRVGDVADVDHGELPVTRALVEHALCRDGLQGTEDVLHEVVRPEERYRGAGITHVLLRRGPVEGLVQYRWIVHVSDDRIDALV